MVQKNSLIALQAVNKLRVTKQLTKGRISSNVQFHLARAAASRRRNPDHSVNTNNNRLLSQYSRNDVVSHRPDSEYRLMY